MTVVVSTTSDFEIFRGVRDGVRRTGTSAVDHETPAADFETVPADHLPTWRLIAVAPISTCQVSARVAKVGA